jgi:hypothetical protein
LGSLLAQNGLRDEAMECFRTALKLMPDLVEAHLCIANAELLLFEKPDVAVKCFEKAYSIDPNLARKWKYTHLWYSRALSRVGRLRDALREVETELTMRPDDRYLWNQKANILSLLWKVDASYKQKAIECFHFRARAFPKDFLGLNELVGIYKDKGHEDEVWPWVDINLKCPIISLSEIARRASISVVKYQVGFLNAQLYAQYRKKRPLKEHFNTFGKAGLSPNREIELTLDYTLMAPFGILGEGLHQERADPNAERIGKIVQLALNSMARIFPAFGSYWLTMNPPAKSDQLVSLFASGLNCLQDAIVIETCWQIKFLTLAFGISYDFAPEGESLDWTVIDSNVKELFLKQVLADWGSDT